MINRVVLTKESLSRGISASSFKPKLFVFEEIDSTNSCAKTLAEADLPEGCIVISEYQTTGRGRLGRSWLSAKGSNLLFSILLRPPLQHSNSGLITFFAAVAVARAVERMTPCKPETKWPNDLLLGGRKFCGILTESSYTNDRLRYTIIGIGVNVNQKSFHGDLAGRAISLRADAGTLIDISKLFHAIINEIDLLYPDVKAGHFSGIMTEWSNRCRMIGEEIFLNLDGNAITGMAERVNIDGSLTISTSTGEQTIYAGDVTLKTKKTESDELIPFDGSSPFPPQEEE